MQTGGVSAGKVRAEDRGAVLYLYEGGRTMTRWRGRRGGRQLKWSLELGWFLFIVFSLDPQETLASLLVGLVAQPPFAARQTRIRSSAAGARNTIPLRHCSKRSRLAWQGERGRLVIFRHSIGVLGLASKAWQRCGREATIHSIHSLMIQNSFSPSLSQPDTT